MVVGIIYSCRGFIFYSLRNLHDHDDLEVYEREKCLPLFCRCQDVLVHIGWASTDCIHCYE